MSDFRTFSIEALLRRVAAARRAGDVTAAQAEWDTCVERLLPRIRAAVKAYRTVHGDRIPAHDQDEVVFDAAERACRRMIHTLQTLDERTLRAAVVGCAHNACLTYFRKLGAYSKGIAGSLDERAFDVGEGGRFDSDIARRAEFDRFDDEAAFEASDRVQRALASMKHERRRRAIELREQGHDYEGVAEALDTSVENAYQLYCRGLKDLRGLMER